MAFNIAPFDTNNPTISQWTQSGTDTLDYATMSANNNALNPFYSSVTAAGVPTFQTGVTNVIDTGYSYIVTLDNTVIWRITGTVNHNTEEVRIIFNKALTAADGTSPATGSALIGAAQAIISLSAAGVYNFGHINGQYGLTVAPAGAVASGGVGWEFTGQDNRWFTILGNRTGAKIANRGTININGGTILGQTTFTNRGNINNLIGGRMIIQGNATADPTRPYVARLDSAGFAANQLTLEQGSILFNSGAVGSTFTMNRSRGTVGYWNQAGGTGITILNSSVNSNTVDAGTAVGTTTKFINLNVGSGAFVSGPEAANGAVPQTANDWGIVYFTKQILSNFTDTQGNALTGTLYIRDGQSTLGTGGNARRSANGSDNTNDFVYVCTIVAGAITGITYHGAVNGNTYAGTDAGSNSLQANLSTANPEIILGIHNTTSAQATAVSTDTTIVAGTLAAVARNPMDPRVITAWGKDKRTDGALGIDTLTATFVSYDSIIDSPTLTLTGTQPLTITRSLTADPSITLSRADVIARNTAVGANLAVNGASVNINTSISDTDIYDIVKYRKEINITDIELPTRTTTFVRRDGNATNYNGLNLNIGTGIIATISGNHTNIGAFNAGNETLVGSYAAQSITNLNHQLGSATTSVVINCNGSVATFNNNSPIYTNVGMSGGQHAGIATANGQTPTFTNCNSQPEWVYASTTDLNFNGGSHGMTITTATSPATWDVQNITDGNFNVVIDNIPTGTGVIDITTDAVSLPVIQAWVAGLDSFRSQRFNVITPPTILTIPVAGKGVFVTNADALTPVVEYAAGAEIDIRAIQATITGDTRLRFVFKPTDNLETNTVYPIVRLGFNNNEITDGQPNFTFAAAPYPGVLIGDLTPEGPDQFITLNGGDGVVTDADAFNSTPAVATFTYTVAAGANLSLGELPSKYFLLALGNTNAYLQASAESYGIGAITEDALIPATNGTTVDTRVVQLTNPSNVVTLSNVNTNGAIAPEVELGVLEMDGSLSTARVATALFVANAPTDGISQSQVAQGALSAIDQSGIPDDLTALQTSATEGNNAAGFLINRRRLGNKGLPPSQQYDSSTDYTGNL
nr:hypothetical protein [Gammaproteobacteria bacterium]